MGRLRWLWAEVPSNIWYHVCASMHMQRNASYTRSHKHIFRFKWHLDGDKTITFSEISIYDAYANSAGNTSKVNFD